MCKSIMSNIEINKVKRSQEYYNDLSLSIDFNFKNHHRVITKLSINGKTFIFFIFFKLIYLRSALLVQQVSWTMGT